MSQRGGGGGGYYSQPQPGSPAGVAYEKERAGLLSATTTANNNKNNGSQQQQMQLPPLKDYITAYVSLLYYHFPGLCKFGACLAVFFVLVFIANIFFNPLEEFGKISPAFAMIGSKSELRAQLSKVDHWCLLRTDKNCLCEDPLSPIAGPLQDRGWQAAFSKNQMTALQSSHHSPNIAFLGAGAVEALNGNWLGKRRSIEVGQINGQYEKFKKDNNYDSVALGIAGDTSPNVLWRMQHGEMPVDFKPRVWWLVLGENDLTKMQCSEEVVVLGIIRVVEELLESKPNAQIVINLLFPMVDMRDDESYPYITDFEHSITGIAAGGGSGGRKSLRVPHRNHHHRKLRRFRSSSSSEDVMDANKHRMRKYRPLTGFTRRKKLPLFTSIKAINRELINYASKHADRVHVFDPTTIFAKRSNRDGGKYILMKSWITRQGHMTPYGYERWLSRVNKKLEEMGHDNPELIVPTRDDDIMNRVDVDDDRFGGGGGDDDDDDEDEYGNVDDDTATRGGEDEYEEEGSEEKDSDDEDRDRGGDSDEESEEEEEEEDSDDEEAKKEEDSDEEESEEDSEEDSEEEEEEDSEEDSESDSGGRL